ncbi:oxygenase MpaB family protein [Streptomyces sp. NPDC056244]|uniref:oxygenase MpaB family protein n=1 Tax=Streptomyces sp. NPDC056244 TaxID=3345762 RepID=UPI0035D54CA5
MRDGTTTGPRAAGGTRAQAGTQGGTQRGTQGARAQAGARAGGGYAAYARLVLETMPEEAKAGLSLGFIRTFGIPDIARVLYATGRMTDEPKARAKATGVAMFALIGEGVDSEEGRRIVADLRRVHTRPGITPELMHYVLACFTVCPLRFIDTHGHRRVTAEERAAAYSFHRALATALDLPDLRRDVPDLPNPPGLPDLRRDDLPSDDLPDPPDLRGNDLPAVERWMTAYETAHFAPTEAGRALWHSASQVLLSSRLPAFLSRLSPLAAAALLDPPLTKALQVPNPPWPTRPLITYALKTRSRKKRPPTPA